VKKLLLVLALALLVTACGVSSQDLADNFGVSDEVAYPLMGLERSASMEGSFSAGGFIFFHASGQLAAEQGILFSVEVDGLVVVLEFSFSKIEFVMDGTFPPTAQFTWAGGRTRFLDERGHERYNSMAGTSLADVIQGLTGVVTIHISQEVFNDQVQPIILGDR
jgi:hypothetical protein